MNRLLKIMTTNPRLENSLGLNLLKQRLNVEQHARSLFDSTSFVVPKRNIVTQRSEPSQDTSTQTSKTVISLSTPRMSPDSLSPKADYQHLVDEDHNIDKAPGGYQFARKNCILRYLQKSTTSGENKTEETLPDNSLTKVFLDKARGRRKMQESLSPRITRSNFLQQTSPLRKIMPVIQEQNFKSHSYAVFPEDPQPRFKVKHVKEKPAVHSDITKPVKYFCEKELALNIPRSSPRAFAKNHSFMSPTFSSEQKNKMREIKKVTKLISPTRRGRSASPKTNVQRCPSIQKKVPYIDKSSSSIFHGMGDTVFELNILSSSTIHETCLDTNPEHELVQAIAKLKDVDWNVSLRGLVDVIEVCRTVDTNLIYPHMTVINQRIIDMLKSSRSHVCRTTCKAVGHLFEYIKDTRRPEFDEIVDTLLCRTADSNKFIRQDANLALDCMVTHIPIVHAIRSLCARGPDHKNVLVRIATARLVVCAVVIASPSYVLNPNNSDYTRRRIILNMVKFLNDKTLETRKYGERLYKLFYGDRMFDIYIRRYLEKETIQKLKSCFKNQHKNGTH